VDFREEDEEGRAMVTMDEERVQPNQKDNETKLKQKKNH